MVTRINNYKEPQSCDITLMADSVEPLMEWKGGRIEGGVEGGKDRGRGEI